jgi:uncharacterized membrane protein YesL
MVRGEERGIIKDFFHSFRMNFKQALPIGIVFVLLAVLLTVDIYALTYLVTIPSDIAQFLIVVVSLIGLLVLIIGIITAIVFIVRAVVRKVKRKKAAKATA